MTRDFLQALLMVTLGACTLMGAITLAGHLSAQREAAQQEARAKLYLQCLASVERMSVNQNKSTLTYLPSCHQ